MVKKLIVVLVVLGLGVAGGYFARPALDRATGAGGEVDAEVVAERREPDRLVLTLRMGEQTMLATFRNRTDDIAELVAPGDTITLRVRSTSVFADDAPILRVARPAAEEGLEDDDESDDEDDDESDDESDDEGGGEGGGESDHEDGDHASDHDGALARVEPHAEAPADPPPAVDEVPEEPVVDPGPPATTPARHHPS